jgi:hypothetical protein
MRKAIVGLVAAGSLVGVFTVARRVRQKLRGHFAEMAAHCKQMAAEVGGGRQAVGKT